MIVHVDGKTYRSNREAILIVLQGDEKKSFENMADEDDRIVFAPEGTPRAAMLSLLQKRFIHASGKVTVKDETDTTSKDDD